MEEKKRVIVTGASGFIGKHLCEYLIDKYDVIGIDRVMYYGKTDKFHTFLNTDINDDLFQKWGSELDNIYAVIHLAAKAGVRESQEKFDEYVKDNILGTKSILDMCAKSWKPKVLIFTSSSSIHKNMSPYSLTKVTGESMVRMYQNNGMIDCKCITIRPYNIYGPNQRTGLVTHNFIKNIIKDKPVTINGNGLQTRRYTYISDLCEVYKLAIECNELDSGEYDIYGQRDTNLYELLYIISQQLNKSYRITYNPKSKFDSMSSEIGDTICKFSKITGWKPKTSLEDGIKCQINKVLKYGDET